MDLTAGNLKKEIRKSADPQKAKVLQGFFKTGPGQYGEGDRFLGVNIPVLRRLVKPYHALALEEISGLICSRDHEDRLAALMILVHRFRKGSPRERAAVYRFYFKQVRFINNWDLVDLSAPYVPGVYWLEAGEQTKMHELAASRHLWHRRIAMVGSFAFIRAGRFREPLALAEKLLNDPQDLMHKAAGWMLREVGKRDLAAEEAFLNKHVSFMPRTMLRYAIEKFPETKRRFYMNKKRRS